jgi:hypothetical protein
MVAGRKGRRKGGREGHLVLPREGLVDSHALDPVSGLDFVLARGEGGRACMSICHPRARCLLFRIMWRYDPPSLLPSLPTYHQVMLQDQGDAPRHLAQRGPLRHLLDGHALMVLVGRKPKLCLQGVPVLVLAGVRVVRRQHGPAPRFQADGDGGGVPVVSDQVLLLGGAVVH